MRWGKRYYLRKKEGEPIFYYGPSMGFTLKPFDDLQIVAYSPEDKIRGGDIVVFPRPGSDSQHIVHRVISSDTEGVRTQGDNCKEADPWIIRRDFIIGRVAYARRGTATICIYRGLAGSLFALFVRAAMFFMKALRAVAKSIFRYPPLKLLLRRIYLQQRKPRVLFFDSSCGRVTQLIVGSRAIARRLDGERDWDIYWPFSLFMDSAILSEILCGTIHQQQQNEKSS